ncbi:hypothetical protein E2562_006415 [Oryza meyeriana var. granulata]|uniref:Glycosyltransferase n=1 Tax=Oryza meyeriana var. granulata TaxID=110450 RepID=A0A6G1EHU7_9ORYZ|nr:hypothetical protein E2562_006415 [Oryza meyeriana var. granulata]
MAATQNPHVVLLACPGAGHVLPVIEFARRLTEHHGFTATIITYTNLSSSGVSSSSSSLGSLPSSSISVATIPAVPLDDLPADVRIETRIITVVRRALPHVRTLLAALISERGDDVVAFAVDMFCSWVLPVAAELGVPKYIFFLPTLMALAFMLHLPELDAATTCEYRDLPEPVRLPGCMPLRGVDLFDTVQDRSNQAYGLMVEMARHHHLADGFLVNTFHAMEHDTISAFRELSSKGVYPPVYPVGPFFRACSGEAAEHRCIRWLDDQPAGSVLYVCFGSGGALSVNQTAELAAGLEASGQRFLWVVHLPSDKDSSAGYFSSDGHDQDPLSNLPEGFLNRNQGTTGLAVPTWAPQVEILNHPAVGGFLSHCGWNSTLESVAAGVPTVAWPLFAEQRMNAVMLEERLGMALRPKAREDGVVTREEVAAVVLELMVGEKGASVRSKTKELQMASATAWTPGGPSCKALEAIIGKWKGGTDSVVNN